MKNTTLVPPSDGRTEGKDITKLGELWQEEIMNLSETTPESLDALENRIQDILHRLGKAIMEWKLLRGYPRNPDPKEWNSSLHKDKCPKCDSKVHNRKRTKQILTTVANIDYERYMSYCPKCKNTEYPLDSALGLHPLQRMSSSVEELAILCGASWDYGKSEYVLCKGIRGIKKGKNSLGILCILKLKIYQQNRRFPPWIFYQR